MPADPRRVKDLFVAALEIADSAERSAFLDRECAANPELRGRLDALLRAHDNPASAVDRPLAVPAASAPTRTHSPDPPPTGTFESADATADYRHQADAGTRLGGKYKLIEEVGEGGMGTVWVAQQTEPVRRTVAVKLIKAGMDSRAVLARFEAERQALALMDHPNIARVLDGGGTPDGRPFFVMELVKGTPITAYCDQQRLTPRERLELFVPVCQAIQHAHQKGVIHRDIKPSNVLVALYDDKPVPKVIDFGIAKATGQALTDKTLMTGFGAVVGTPEYMSPEQASLNNLDIDTRSDVYALGVLLYELLAGSPPFRSDELKKAGLLEMLRVVREAEPPRPSTKLSTADSLPSLSAARGTEPKKLAGLLRGELDWIVMKALEKDRARRYESASTFAVDVQRYLAGEAVQAHPPRTTYRLRKFARKNRLVLGTGAAFAGLLVAAAAVSGWLAVKATEAETHANQNAADARRSELRAEANAAEANRSRLETAEEKAQSDIKAMSLQVDLDLAELKVDPRLGLLRLARLMRDRGAPVQVRAVGTDGNTWSGVISRGYDHRPEYRAIREFVTVAVLAAGQDFAPLLPPPSHDGAAVVRLRLSPDGRTVLTRGEDGTARLWNSLPGRPVAVLREAKERVVDCDFSPDGRTVYTYDDTNTFRFWDAPQGTFRARAEARPYAVPKADKLDRTTFVGDDRVLTVLKVLDRYSDDPGTHAVNGVATPVELWDARSGRLVAQLNAPARFGFRKDRGLLGPWFVGGGQWVVLSAPGPAVVVVSAADGRELARLVPSDGGADWFAEEVSVADGVMAVAYRCQEEARVRLWHTATWQPKTPAPAVQYGTPVRLAFAGREYFGVCETLGFDGLHLSVARYGEAKPVAVFPLGMLPGPGLALRESGVAATREGQVVDTRTWQRLRPTGGRKYRPELARFAPDGRFVGPNVDGEDGLLDTLTEKHFYLRPSIFSGQAVHVPAVGLILPESLPGAALRLLPTARPNLPPDLLELWAQVAVRGELGPDGEFVKWDEPTWEAKRQQLATAKPPHPDVPFPGYVATDKLHWLRAEFNEAKDADKLHLAHELLRRAEAGGDRNEAVRWRREIEQRPPAVAPAPREVKW